MGFITQEKSELIEKFELLLEGVENKFFIATLCAQIAIDHANAKVYPNSCASGSLPDDFDSIIDTAEKDGWSFYKGKWSRDGYRSRGSGELYRYIKGNDR